MVRFFLHTLVMFTAAVLLSRACFAAGAPELDRFDDWQVRCFAVKSVSPCDALFGAYQKATGRRIVTVSIAYAPVRQSSFIQIAVPLGIAVPKGVTVVAGAYRSSPFEVRRCDRNGCFVEAIAAPDFIAALRANSDQKGSLDVVADGGKPVSLIFSLKGFARAYDAMLKAAERHTSGGQ